MKQILRTEWFGTFYKKHFWKYILLWNTLYFWKQEFGNHLEKCFWIYQAFDLRIMGFTILAKKLACKLMFKYEDKSNKFILWWMDPCINLIHDSIHATNLKIRTPSLNHVYIMHGLMNQLTNIYPTSLSKKNHLVLSTHIKL